MRKYFIFTFIAALSLNFLPLKSAAAQEETSGNFVSTVGSPDPEKGRQNDEKRHKAIVDSCIISKYQAT